MRKNTKRAQTLFEYVVIICVFAAALLASGVYILRAFQGRYRESADVFGQREQYQPDWTVETTQDPVSVQIAEEPFVPESCPNVVKQVEIFQTEAAQLRDTASGLDSRASTIEGQAGMSAIGNNELTRAAQEVRNNAAAKRQQADLYDEQVAKCRANRPECF